MRQQKNALWRLFPLVDRGANEANGGHFCRNFNEAVYYERMSFKETYNHHRRVALDKEKKERFSKLAEAISLDIRILEKENIKTGEMEFTVRSFDDNNPLDTESLNRDIDGATDLSNKEALKDGLTQLFDQIKITLIEGIRKELSKSGPYDGKKIRAALQVAQNHREMVTTIVKSNGSKVDKKAVIKTCYKKSTSTRWTWGKFGKLCLAILAAAVGAVIGGVVAGLVTGGVGAIPGAIAGGGIAAATVLGSGAGGAVLIGVPTSNTLFKPSPMKKAAKAIRKTAKKSLKEPTKTNWRAPKI